MTGFVSQQGVLTCDGVPLPEIAREVGTPVHVYSASVLTARYRAFDAPFAGVEHRLHYAIKANATLGVVSHLRALGARADANSGGEIEVALRAGFDAADIVFTGVGKTRAELERAIAIGVLAINAESTGEVGRIAEIARGVGRRARVAVRINPDVEAGSHPHISTGSLATKFGVSIAEARAMIGDMARRSELQIVGLHAHIGSQITATAPIARAAELIAGLARDLMAQGIALEHLDLGGGLGIAYKADQPALAPADYAEAILPAVRRAGLPLVLEPGRWIVAPAGVLVTEVVDLKPRGADGSFVIVDAGMTDLIRPALYGAWHTIEPVAPRAGAPINADVVGPVCETSDTIGTRRDLPPVEVGDLIAIRDTGAYGSVMASNYNRRPIAAEVMVEDGAWRVIRRRQSIDDMLQWDEP